MKAKSWKTTITKQCKAVGTMNAAFVSVIDTLADILEQRDAAYTQFVREGSKIIIERTSDRGAVNSAKNPLWVAWNDLNSQALTYWRDLGLTPKGLKAISDSIQKEEANPLDQMLKEFGR